MDLTEQAAEQMLELLQLFALRHYSFVPPEHVIRLQQMLEKSQRGGVFISSYPILMRIFAFLACTATPPTMSKLGTELGMPPSSTSRVVDWLVRAGIIERIGDPEDRRIVRVRLTENGQHIYRTGMEYNKKQLMTMLAIYTPEEQKHLLQLVHKFVHLYPVEK